MGNLENCRFVLWTSLNSIPLEYKVSKSLRDVNPSSIYKYINIEQNRVRTKVHSEYLLRIMSVPAFLNTNSKLFKLSTQHSTDFLINSFKVFRLQLLKYLVIFNV